MFISIIYLSNYEFKNVTSKTIRLCLVLFGRLLMPLTDSTRLLTAPAYGYKLRYAYR